LIWVALVLVYPLWVLIHEGTHALVARRLGCDILRFRPYPHRLPDGRFVWGSIRRACGELTPHQEAAIAFAPRVPAISVCALLVCVSLLSAPIWVQVLLAGGAVDQIVNSIGHHEKTDLRRWCSGWNHNPWTWRIVGCSVGVASLLFAVLRHVGTI
jgi:hypothetical protein